MLLRNVFIHNKNQRLFLKYLFNLYVILNYISVIYKFILLTNNILKK
jgi:hypothetical protein